MDTTPIKKKDEIQLKNEFIKNWRSFQKYDESPLECYFRECDLLYRNSTDSDYFERALQEDVNYSNRLLISDFKFRNDAKLNVVMSISDIVEKTGSGKSSSGLKFDLLLAKIFGSKFDMSHVAWTPDELDKLIETAPHKSILHLDEQIRKRIGIGSRTTELNLQDMEDTLRSSQICITYCAPQLRLHNHFFVFETFRMTRIKNPACLQCKTVDCANCKMPFWERSGYPEYIYLMLKTKRLTTGLPVPRGLIRVSMPPPELMVEYWKQKDINVEKLKKKEENMWQQYEELAKKIFDLKKNQLIHKKLRGGWVIESSARIKICLYEVKGMRYLPKDGQDLLIEKIKMLLESYAAEKTANDEFNQGNRESEGEEEINGGEPTKEG